MKKRTITIGGVSRESAMLAAGFCMGLSTRKERLYLSNMDRKILMAAGKALQAACLELWPDWFK